jgi:hypothetical protein
MVKFIISILIGILPGTQAAAQQKAEIKIVSSKVQLDTLFIEYEITNKSDKPFTYYRPQLRDVELGLINMWLINSSGKKTSKYTTLSRGELDELIVDKRHCTDILPGNSRSFNLAIDVKKFSGSARLQESGSKFALSIYFNQSNIKCTDCNYVLLDEFLVAEKEIEQR